MYWFIPEHDVRGRLAVVEENNCSALGVIEPPRADKVTPVILPEESLHHGWQMSPASHSHSTTEQPAFF
jgi:hypothetical protein